MITQTDTAVFHETNLKNILSGTEAIFLLELIQSLVQCQSEQEFVSIIRKTHCIIPHEFAVSGMAKLDEHRNILSYNIVNISYPDEWLDIYILKDYCLIDPIVTSSLNNIGVQYWEDIYRGMPPPQEYLSLAADFGLSEGYACGRCNGEGNAGTFYCIAGRSLERSVATEIVLAHLVPHIDQTLARILGCGNAGRRSITLSPREREILLWIRKGKRTWDISRLLHISENTVKFHVKNIFQKLDVISRTQAVAVALEQGLIEID